MSAQTRRYSNYINNIRLLIRMKQVTFFFNDGNEVFFSALATFIEGHRSLTALKFSVTCN